MIDGFPFMCGTARSLSLGVLSGLCETLTIAASSTERQNGPGATRKAQDPNRGP